MRITIERKEQQFDWKTAKYPIKGKSKLGLVVGFSGYKKGAVLQSPSSDYSVYEYSDNWYMRNFTPIIEERFKKAVQIFNPEEYKGDFPLLVESAGAYYLVMNETDAYRVTEDGCKVDPTSIYTYSLSNPVIITDATITINL